MDEEALEQIVDDALDEIDEMAKPMELLEAHDFYASVAGRCASMAQALKVDLERKAAGK